MVSLRNLLSFCGSDTESARCRRAALAFGSGLAALRNRGKPMVSLRNLLSFVAGGARLRLGPRRPTEQRETDGFPP